MAAIKIKLDSFNDTDRTAYFTVDIGGQTYPASLPMGRTMTFNIMVDGEETDVREIEHLTADKHEEGH